jgi:O-antigen ligase/polysaccharide polymerase Wzy-like membrane protein
VMRNALESAAVVDVGRVGVAPTSSAVSPIWVFLVSLLLAPQLWWSPILWWRVDFFVYPFWLLVLVLTGQVREVFRFRAPDWFFVAWLGWIVLSILANGWNDASGEQLFRHFRYLVVYRFVAATIAEEKGLRRAAFAFLTLAMLLAVEGIQHMHSPDGLGWAGQGFGWVDEAAAEIGLSVRIKWVGIFDGPGVFCTIFTVALPFAFRYVVPPSPFLLRVAALAAVITPMMVATYYTGSRGGLLAAAGAVGMFVVSRFKIEPKRLAVFAILGSVLMFAAFSYLPAYLTATKDESKSAQNRVKMWAKSYEMVQENPVFGAGKGNFRVWSGSLVAHNSGLEVMGELGFPGFFAWIGLIYFGFKTVIVRIRELGPTDRRERETLVALVIGVTAYLVSGLFVTLETEIQYFLLGMCAAVARWSQTEVAVTWRDGARIGLIMFAYFAGFKLFVMSYW